MSELNTDIMYLSGVGPRRAELLKKELGIQTLGDLIHIFPHRYIDRSSIQKISDAANLCAANASLQIKGCIKRRTLYGPGNTIIDEQNTKLNFNCVSRLSIIATDESGEMEMVFFRGIKWNYQRLIPGQTFLFFGKPQEFNGRYNMVHPEVDSPQEGNMSQGVMTGVYPSTERLRNSGITGKVMCRLQSNALSLCLKDIKETLPQYVIDDNGLCPLAYAMKNIHFPSDSYALQKASYRLKFEELFLLQLSLLKQKYVRSRSEKGIVNF